LSTSGGLTVPEPVWDPDPSDLRHACSHRRFP
jgi:hypothetical protein